MSGGIPLMLTLQDWSNLFSHYLSLSLLAIGGAITTAPDMHRFLVAQQGWLTDAQCNSSIAIVQSAPGPNVMFIALLGWNVGLSASGTLTGLLGVLVTMTGTLIPSSTLTCFAASWGHRNRDLRAVRAFKQAMAPLVVALLIATGWILAMANGDTLKDWPL